MHAKGDNHVVIIKLTLYLNPQIQSQNATILHQFSGTSNYWMSIVTAFSVSKKLAAPIIKFF